VDEERRLELPRVLLDRRGKLGAGLLLVPQLALVEEQALGCAADQRAVFQRGVAVVGRAQRSERQRGRVGVERLGDKRRRRDATRGLRRGELCDGAEIGEALMATSFSGQ